MLQFPKFYWFNLLDFLPCRHTLMEAAKKKGDMLSLKVKAFQYSFGYVYLEFLGLNLIFSYF